MGEREKRERTSGNMWKFGGNLLNHESPWYVTRWSCGIRKRTFLHKGDGVVWLDVDKRGVVSQRLRMLPCSLTGERL